MDMSSNNLIDEPSVQLWIPLIFKVFGNPESRGLEIRVSDMQWALLESFRHAKTVSSRSMRFSMLIRLETSLSFET
jgi:hypothetical protein